VYAYFIRSCLCDPLQGGQDPARNIDSIGQDPARIILTLLGKIPFVILTLLGAVYMILLPSHLGEFPASVVGILVFRSTYLPFPSQFYRKGKYNEITPLTSISSLRQPSEHFDIKFVTQCRGESSKEGCMREPYCPLSSAVCNAILSQH
jgi:hypothetical protein